MLQQQQQEEVKSMVDLTTRGTDIFIKAYYHAWDTQRLMLNKLYKQPSTLIYNGTVVQGGEAISEFIRGLKPTQHEICCSDCQSLGGSDSLVVGVQGWVKFDKKKWKFSQSFILTKGEGEDGGGGGGYYVLHDCFRLV